MKKILSVLVCAFVLLGLTGCVSDSESGGVTDTNGTKKNKFQC